MYGILNGSVTNRLVLEPKDKMHYSVVDPTHALRNSWVAPFLLWGIADMSSMSLPASTTPDFSVALVWNDSGIWHTTPRHPPTRIRVGEVMQDRYGPLVTARVWELSIIPQSNGSLRRRAHQQSHRGNQRGSATATRRLALWVLCQTRRCVAIRTERGNNMKSYATQVGFHNIQDAYLQVSPRFRLSTRSRTSFTPLWAK